MKRRENDIIDDGPNLTTTTAAAAALNEKKKEKKSGKKINGERGEKKSAQNFYENFDDDDDDEAMNVPFMISRMQRETNEQFTRLRMSFKREHEENVKEKKKMRDTIERLTRIKDDLMKSLTLVTKERDSFREKAMGEKLLLLKKPPAFVEDQYDERKTMADLPPPPPSSKRKSDDNDDNEDEDDEEDDNADDKSNTPPVSRERFQKLQAELMIYREAAAKYRKEKEVALAKLEKYEKQQQQRRRGKEDNGAKRKRPHSPASKYAVFAGEEYTTKDEELEEIGRNIGKDDGEVRERRQRRRHQGEYHPRRHEEMDVVVVVDEDGEHSARKNNYEKTEDEKSFSFNRREDFWAFDTKNETRIKANAVVNHPKEQQQQQQQQQQQLERQIDKPKPKKHVDASKMMMMSKRASLDSPAVGASKKSGGAALTAKKGVSKKVQSLWDDAMKKKTIGDTKTPPPRSRAFFETPKTNEAQINKSTPGEEDVLVIKNTQEEEDEEKVGKEEKNAKRTRQELREEHQQKANTSLPVDKPLREVKYQEVVRGKEARKELIGYACQECERFYAVAGQLDRRACEHGNNTALTNNNNTNNGAPTRNLENSRHRAKYLPPKDPAGYWDLGGFTQTQPDPQKKKATKFGETPPSQENL